ncbi:MAG: branched-chain amino acid ABC transporter permease [Rhizobiales bacterium]|nr:branched-chain amino acid ABC transporter permease [Hyphomicrobiales bacterium]OJY06766.1 MAG: branched-chain amino acid ABC transporter permease [Rhizobiales bacterium 63-22]
MVYLLQQFANAVPQAALYALLAFGYAVSFAVIRRADISYGALVAFAGQLLILFTGFGWNALWLTLPAALAVGTAGALAYTLGAGLAIARAVMRPLRAASANMAMVAALGVTIALMECARLAAGSRSLWLPPLLQRTVIFWRSADGTVALTLMQIVNTILMTAIVLGAALVIARTRFGRHWRAVRDDAFAARLCGVDADRVFLAAYLGAVLIAALAGILMTAYYGTMDSGDGLLLGLKILMIGAVGGYFSPLASAGGAALLAFAETFWTAFAPLVWREPAIFALLVFLLAVSRRESLAP